MEIYKNKSLVLVLGLLAVTLTGCQTVKMPVVEDFDRNVTINSQPEGALVYKNGNYFGTTPYTYSISEGFKGDSVDLTFFKPGYIPVELKFNETPKQDIEFNLMKSNRYLYKLLVDKKIRFTDRTNMNHVMMEPSNRPMAEGSAFIIRDENTDKDIRFRVISINKKYIWLETDDGSNLVYPIIAIKDER